MSAITKNHRVTAQWQALLSGIRAAMAAQGAHPSRCVVLLPFAQMMPLARAHWAAWAAQAGASGFVPRFETTMNWAANPAPGVAAWQPSGDDLRFDAGFDTLTATALLRRAGMGARAALLAPRVLDCALSLAPLAAAQAPAARAAWATAKRIALQAQGQSAQLAGNLALEHAAASVALAWLGVSGFATDALLTPEVQRATELLVLVQGLQSEPVTEALAAQAGTRCARLDWPGLAAAQALQSTESLALHECDDAQDEAERAAAAVLRHLAAGTRPVAVCATDRALTRRVRALLARVGSESVADVSNDRANDADQAIDARQRHLVSSALALRDETGWKLSTTRAAAAVMALLRAAMQSADMETTLTLAKLSPALDAAAVAAWERQLRTGFEAPSGSPAEPALGAVYEPNRPIAHINNAQDAIKIIANQCQDLLSGLRAPRRLSAWLADTQAALDALGLWQRLADDAAGTQLLQALYWDGFADELPSRERMALPEFVQWVTQALEAASFSPEPPSDPDVMVLPLSQLLGRPIAALVLPGCDEVNLPAAPELPGPWTRAQRELLGLPSREQAQATQASAWAIALQMAPVDLLRRRFHEGRALQESPLLQALQLRAGQHRAPNDTIKPTQGRANDVAPSAIQDRATHTGQTPAAIQITQADDPREAVSLTAQPTAIPSPSGAALPIAHWSASAYADLRACPYKFFAQRMLKLRAWDELDQGPDKRDFGNWLHAVLHQFHTQNEPLAQESIAWAAMLNIAAEQTTEAQGWSEADFLPYASQWPQLRSAYIEWLVQQRQTGYSFMAAEQSLVREHAGLQLVGKLDRLDRMRSTQAEGGGQVMVLDYKTEAAATSAQRVKAPLEDTQLAFYAALAQPRHASALQAAYLNLGDQATLYLQPSIEEARDALLDGLAQDAQRIASGESLRPLGEGSACAHCEARGLCRKDWWAAP